MQARPDHRVGGLRAGEWRQGQYAEEAEEKADKKLEVRSVPGQGVRQRKGKDTGSRHPRQPSMSEPGKERAQAGS